MAATRQRSRKDVAIASSLAIAVSLVSGGMIAHAQSFQISGYSVPAGTATVFAGPNTTDIQVISNDAVINWTPSDTGVGGGPINFQPAGTTATFTGNTGFTVLNRIVPTDPTRAIQFNGSVLSQYITAAGAPVTGGTVFFYSPGGIILGASSTFDVGNLGLTTSDVTYDATGAFGGANGTVVFQQASQPTAAIQISSGAQVNALNAGSYVAMVAPSVANSGTLNVNGSAALVAAEGATIKFSPDGLFDIQVDVGSDAGANALTNTGTITGPAGNALVQSHRIYFVAVPKNVAIGMAIAQGSQLGFDVAAAADTDGNAVILSAGGDVAGGVAQAYSAAGSTQPGSILVTDTGGAINFTSRVTATSTTFQLSNTGKTSFASNLDAAARDSATFLSALGGTVTVAGNLTLTTDYPASTPGAPDDGGIALLQAQNGGSISIAGNALVSALASEDRNGDNAVTGGTVQVGAVGTGASLTVGGDLTADASAFDSSIAALPVTGGNSSVYAVGGGTVGVSGQTTVNADATALSSQASTGGQALAIVQDGGSLSLTGLAVAADAASNFDNIGGAGGAATGGTALVLANGTIGASMTVSGIVSASANGIGGDGACVSCLIDGGSGTGGQAGIQLSAAGHTFDFGQIALSATGQGGSGTNGAAGAGTGGITSITADAGSSTIVRFGTTLTSNGIGGSATLFDGGAGTGGQAYTQTTAGSLLDLRGNVTLSATGSGGSTGPASGRGGDGTGGTASIGVPAGTTSLAADANGTGDFILDAEGFGGNGLDGGSGQGGATSVLANGPGTFIETPGTFGGLSLYSNGAAGSARAAGGAAGNAQGGTSSVSATGSGSITVNSQLAQYASTVAAPDVSIAGLDGGTGTGGTVELSQDTGGSVVINGNVYLEANGIGSDNSGGGSLFGGVGTGGTINILVNDPGGIALNGTDVSLVANGIGGSGVLGPLGAGGGAGLGGSTNVTATNGVLQTSSALNLSSIGYGGSAFVDGNGGSGTGGSATVSALAGTSASAITLSGSAASLSTDAIGYGGDAAGNGAGGLGTGGNATVMAEGGNINVAGALLADVLGQGGVGGTISGAGGDGQGGTVVVNASNGFTILAGTAALGATALGGQNLSGGTGGSATGGAIYVNAFNGGAMTFSGSVTLSSAATGGNSTAAGGIGGAATGGVADLLGNGGTLTVNGNAAVDASAGGGLGDQATGAGSGGAGTGGSALIASDGEDAVNTSLAPGSLTVAGIGTVTASGTGGSGGTGGNGEGGTAGVNAHLGQATLAGSTVIADGAGGAGIAGGAGGSGTGGLAGVLAFNSLSGPGSLDAGAVSIAADGIGGAGGAGLAAGQAGGAGGAGTGGETDVYGNAGNGTLTASTVTASTYGIGGAGGAGSSGTPGGDGGLGGDGNGGVIQAGVDSGIATPGNTGSASFGSIQMFALGNGGVGGDAGTGATGGNGGTGNGGGATLLVRGAPVTVTGDVILGASGTGGAAGAGAPATITGGATVSYFGGVGFVAGAKVLVTNRLNDPTQRGTLTVGGAITGTADATDGAGFQSVFTSMGADPIEVTITNSDVNVTGGLDVFASANQVTTGATPSIVDISGSTANFGTGFAFNTSGDLTLNLDSSNLSAGNIDLEASNWILGAAPTLAGTLIAGSGLTLYSTQDLVAYANLQTSFGTSLSAPGSIRLGNVDIGGAFSATAMGGSILLGNGTASDFQLDAATDLTMGTLDASGFSTLDAGGAMATGALTVARSVDLTSGGASTIAGAIQAGADVTFHAGGNVSVGDISSGTVTKSTISGDGYNIGIASGGTVVTGSLSALQFAGIGAQQTITTGALSGAAIMLLGSSDITVDSISSATSVLIADYSMVPLGGTIGPTYNPVPVFLAAPVATTGAIRINGATVAGGSFHAATQSSFASGNITAGNDILLAVTGNVSSGLLSAGGPIAVTGAQVDSTGITSTSGTVSVASTGFLTAGLVAGSGNVLMQSGQSIATGAVASSGGSVTLTAAQDIATGTIGAATSVSAGTGGGFTSGDIVGPGGVTIAAGTGIGIGSINSGTQAASLVTTSGDVLAGDVAAGSLTAGTPGTLTLGAVQVANNANLSAGLAATIQSLTAGGAVGISAGSLSSGNLVAGDSFDATTSGAMSTGAISGVTGVDVHAGGALSAGGVSSSAGAVGLTAAQSVRTGDIGASLDVFVSAGQAFSAGAIQAGAGVQATAGTAFSSGNILSGADTTLGAGGSMATGSIASGGALNATAGQAFSASDITSQGDVSVDAGASLATGAIMSPGRSIFLNSGTAMTLGGAVSATNFQSSAGSDMIAGAITADTTLSATAGGKITVAGPWVSPSISLVSNDLDILAADPVTGTPGGLNAGTTGQIGIQSTNDAGMFIGDGLSPGTGYALTGAEWGRINSGSVSISALDNPQLGTDMTIGDLTITGPLSGSTIDDPNGSVSFTTGVDGIVSGTIRVVGNVAATGFQDTNTLSFDATAFELDAATGSIKIDNGSGGLSGIMRVSADFIHIADGSILGKLRNNPFYAERFTDLNSPAAVQRPDGVFNARAFNLYPGQTLDIQNTGTAAVPAGFVTGFSVSDVTPPDAPPAGGVSVIINGAFDTPSGPVTGIEAYNMLVNDPGADFTGFATDSMLNSCVLSARSCGNTDVATPTSGEFDTLSTDSLGNESFPQQEDGNSLVQEDGAKAGTPGFDVSIAAPEPLIDTRPLRPPPNITEPLTGGGNPALTGTGTAPGNGGAQ